MSQNLDIELKPVIPKEYPTFIKNLQEAFSPAIIEKFGTNEYLPSKNDILSSLTAKNAEVFHIIYNNQCASGVVLMIDKNTHYNSLDLFFISPKYHGDGLGLATWKTIEKKYPDTITWRTITPYFEQRNIHFYMMNCQSKCDTSFKNKLNGLSQFKHFLGLLFNSINFSIKSSLDICPKSVFFG